MVYSPSTPPQFGPEFQPLISYIRDELEAIAQEIVETDVLDLRTTHREPERPREGMIICADGTDWDPGDGGGPYIYFGAAWVPMFVP